MDEDQIFAPFRIDRHEAQTPLWQKIKKHCDDQIRSLRMQNDNDMPPEKTAALRAAIRAYKHLAALDKPAPREGSE